MSTHSITITAGSDFTLHCAEVTDDCADWAPCEHPDCPTFDWAYYDGEHLHHGVNHGMFRQQWEVRTGDCALLVARSAADHIARTLAATSGPGTYPLVLSWEGDTLALRVGGTPRRGGLWIVGGCAGPPGSRTRPALYMQGIGGQSGQGTGAP